MVKSRPVIRLIGLVFAVLCILAIPALIFGDRLEVILDGQKAVQFMRAQGPWGAIVGIGLIVADLVIPVPAPAIMAALGLIYGALVGGTLASIGSFSAALLGYVLCRLLGSRAATWIAGETQLEKLSGFFQRHGVWAIALSRWMPMIPEVLACLAGLTRMPLARFALGNFIGSAAVGYAYAWFGARGEQDPGSALAVAVLLPYLALPLFLVLLARQRRKQR